MIDPNVLIEEPWWQVTTATGLTQKLRAPVEPTGELRSPAWWLRRARVAGPDGLLNSIIESHSEITKEIYTLDLSNVWHIREYTRSSDPTRLIRAQMRASQGSSPPPSPSDQIRRSPGGRFKAR